MSRPVWEARDYERLENKLHRPLHDAGSDAPAASGVERRGQLPNGGGIRRKAGTGEVRVVRYVEGFESDVEAQPLKERRVLGDREILIDR